MIWSYSEDNTQWPKGRAVPTERKDGKGKAAGRRHTVLGKWHQIKKEMYEQHLLMHQGVENLVPMGLIQDETGERVEATELPF
jgi:hypothetical protein